MNVPRRIVDGGSGDWERQVLESAADDVPSPEFRKRIAKELGVLASVAALTSTTTAAGQTLGVFAWIKLLGAGAIVGLATVGVSYAVRNPSVPAADPATRTAVPTARETRRAAGASRVEETRPTPTAAPVEVPPARDSIPPLRELPTTKTAPTPSVPGPLASPASSLPSHAVMAPTDSALSEELRIVERVRRALATGDAKAALSELDRYEAAPGQKLFALEAEVLRIEALARVGDDSEARSLARRFLAAHPESPYVQRVRSLVGDRP